MRKLFALWLIIPFVGFGQVKNVIKAERVFPKMDKTREFETALTAHAQKYHTGDWKWRVWQIETGPDAGGYMITEGPNSWDQIDKRGDLGAAHMDDWYKSVAVNLTDKFSAQYSTFEEELSTVQLMDYADKIAISHVFPKPGMADQIENQLKMAKKAWAAGNQTVAVYSSSASGPGQYTLVYRYKQGLKEREKGFRAPFKDRYETANGKGSYGEFLEGVSKYADPGWSEILFFRPDLSSK
jgi:hypothetical protein